MIYTLRYYIGKRRGFNGYIEHDAVKFYPPFKDIWKYVIGKYESCWYQEEKGKAGHIFKPWLLRQLRKLLEN